MKHKKRKKTRSLTDKNSIESIINFFQSVGAFFEVSITNYTTSINYLDTGQKYLKSFRSKKCFSAYKKIEKDIKRFEIPKIDSSNLKYFCHDIHEECTISEVYQIDIKKAYATVLLNKGYITEQTYEYMNKISKSDRLASVGMLASIKNVFTYNNGNIKEHEIIQNKYKNYFFICVKEVESIMNVCKMACVNSYILTWVDSIYIKKNDADAKEIQRILLYNGFNCEVDTLKDFSVKFTNNKILVSYKNKEEKEKRFYIPHSDNLTKNYFVSFIVNSNKNKNEPDKNKNRF